MVLIAVEKHRNNLGTPKGVNTMRTIVTLTLLTFTSVPLAFAADDMKAFPPAEEGMTRHIIRLPQLEDETAFKIELIVGKTERTDATNHYFFAGGLETVNIPGWGYDRYVLRKLGPMAGTLMAIDPNAPQVDRFISLSRETILRYNSRLPYVVYVPIGTEVRYRLWRAEMTSLSPPEERR
jgi:ecotin